MGRPPTYITAEGQKRIRSEIDRLRERLADVGRQKADAVSETANAWHDNAGFEIAQATENVLLQRIADLEGLLARGTLVEVTDESGGTEVRLGSRVEIRFADGEEMILSIRGIGEVDLGAGVISASSPLASAILGARVGDKRSFAIGGSTTDVTIIGIVGKEAPRG